MISAFIIGFFGSAHCAGMCGPLNIAFAGHSIRSFTAYHFGRMISYITIGAFFGILGESLSFFNLQHIVALAGGIFLLLVYGVPLFRSRLEGAYYHSRLYKLLKTKLSAYYNSPYKWMASGLLNGLLPCGLVYMAAAGALLVGSFWLSVAYMILFALGTLPALILVVLVKQKSHKFFGGLSRFVVPVGLISAGILIFRGVLVDLPNLDQLVNVHISGFISACGF